MCEDKAGLRLKLKTEAPRTERAPPSRQNFPLLLPLPEPSPHLATLVRRPARFDGLLPLLGAEGAAGAPTLRVRLPPRPRNTSPPRGTRHPQRTRHPLPRPREVHGGVTRTPAGTRPPPPSRASTVNGHTRAVIVLAAIFVHTPHCTTPTTSGTSRHHHRVGQRHDPRRTAATTARAAGREGHVVVVAVVRLDGERGRWR